MGEKSNDPELMESEVIFEGDRLEPIFSDIPGQWYGIWLRVGSVSNVFNFTTIKNSTFGIRMQSSLLTLKNVQIYNSTNVGLLAINSLINGENVVINNSGQSSLAIQLGGSYEFRHCTFANYWTEGFRSFPTVSIENTFGDDLVTDLVKANFINCIIYGNERREFSLFQDPGGTFNFKFENSLVHFEDPTGEFSDNPLYDFTNPALYPATRFNLDPVFQDTELNNFNIESGTSGADGIGKPGVLPLKDLNGIDRNNEPDAGAYESIEL